MQPVNESEGLILQLSNITLEAMDPATDLPLGETETKRSDDVGGETKRIDQVALTRRITGPKFDVTKRRYSYQAYVTYTELPRPRFRQDETKRSHDVGGETLRNFRGLTRRIARPKIGQTKRKRYRLIVDPGRNRREGLSKLSGDAGVGTATKGVMDDDQSVRI